MKNNTIISFCYCINKLTIISFCYCINKLTSFIYIITNLFLYLTIFVWSICFCTELSIFCFSTDLFTFCLSTCLGIFCFFDCLCSVLVLWEATILYVGIKLSNDIVTLCIRECHESFSKSAVSLMKVELI